jgi:hypothetical protein
LAKKNFDSPGPTAITISAAQRRQQQQTTSRPMRTGNMEGMVMVVVVGILYCFFLIENLRSSFVIVEFLDAINML